jgi:uncharacterized protein YodC (DUF2158 family)
MIKVGDTVRLRCGSPFMAVLAIHHEELVAVCWYFDGNILEYDLPPDVLEVVDIDKEMKKAENMVISALKNQLENSQSSYSN